MNLSAVLLITKLLPGGMIGSGVVSCGTGFGRCFCCWWGFVGGSDGDCSGAG